MESILLFERSELEVTIFDKILAGEIPATNVYEDDHVLAFKDINPQAPVHVLVIPKVRVERFTELKDRPVEEVGLFFTRVSLVATQLGLEEGFRIVINNGSQGGQDVEYLHAHILGGRQMMWPPG